MDGFHRMQDDLEKRIDADDESSGTAVSEWFRGSDSVKLSEAKTVREKINLVIHTNRFQITIIILVLVDVFLVIGELLFDLDVFKNLDEHQAETAPKVLHYMSIIILSLFVIEVFVKIYAMRLELLKHKLEIFDAIVVFVSFGLDVAYATQEESVADGSGLLIILRLWRVTRILNGIILSEKSRAEKRLTKEKTAKEAVEAELRKCKNDCQTKVKEITRLKGVIQRVLEEHGINDFDMDKEITGHEENSSSIEQE